MSEHSDDAGTTLVEILVVMAILGLAMLLGMTGWQGWREAHRLDDAANRMIGLLDMARGQARRMNTTVPVSVDIKTGTIGLSNLDHTVVVPTGAALSATLADLGAAPEILFLSDGSSTGGELRLSRNGSETIKLGIAWSDGRVRRVP